MEGEIRTLTELVAPIDANVQLDSDDPALQRRATLEHVQDRHRRFSLAQDAVLTKLLARQRSNELVEQQVEHGLRKIADAIAWELVDRQLHIARRLFREQRPPSLHESNINSVRDVAAVMQRADFSNLVVYSDLTTFVQAGDLLVAGPDGSITFVEVKSGKKNHDILASLLSDQPTLLDRKSGEQRERIAKQLARLTHITNVLNDGESVDPDTGFKVKIPADPVVVESYDAKIGDMIDDAKSKRWAIDVLDDCLFIGAYAGEVGPAAPLIFRAWFDACDSRKGFPFVDFNECMIYPLALPLFIRNLGVARILDLLFGRAIVYLAFHLDRFVERANASGIEMRWSTRREAAALGSTSAGMKIENRVAIAHRGEQTIALTPGLIFRTLFHGSTPHSIIRMIDKLLGGA